MRISVNDTPNYRYSKPYLDWNYVNYKTQTLIGGKISDFKNFLKEDYKYTTKHIVNFLDQY